MSDPVEMIDELPFPATTVPQMDSITLYGVPLGTNAEDGPAAPNRVRAIIYGFCFQGHCYRLGTPGIYVFNAATGTAAQGCGFQAVVTGSTPAYTQWSIDSTDRITFIERRTGTAGDLLLDFNLPGRSPASMSYSARVILGSRAGRIHE